MAATYSPTWYSSTIGANGLNFSVRNGKRWIPVAIATLSLLRHFCILLRFSLAVLLSFTISKLPRTASLSLAKSNLTRNLTVVSDYIMLLAFAVFYVKRETRSMRMLSARDHS